MKLIFLNQRDDIAPAALMPVAENSMTAKVPRTVSILILKLNFRSLRRHIWHICTALFPQIIVTIWKTKIRLCGIFLPGSGNGRQHQTGRRSKRTANSNELCEIRKNAFAFFRFRISWRRCRAVSRDSPHHRHASILRHPRSGRGPNPSAALRSPPPRRP